MGKPSTAGLLYAWLILLHISPGAAAAGLTDDLYDNYALETAGFCELRGGTRLQNDGKEKQLSIGEARIRLEVGREIGDALLNFKGDLLTDGVTETLDLQLRELNLSASPLDSMDIKLGRAVYTWGTGDLLFINDTFAKDWQSFFIGRNEEYLKYPGNGIKVSFFSDFANLDLIYNPLFEGSRFINGERLSYYNPGADKIVGRSMQLADDEPNRWFRDDEIHGRLSKNLSGMEFALYGYSGFWKEPEGYSTIRRKNYFPKLNVWGGSVRTTILRGIGNAEIGYYDSTENRNSNNPLIRPCEMRWLVGFERELAHELTGSVQYYMETIRHYDNYRQALMPGAAIRNKNTGTVTMRLRKLLMEQNLTLSLFVYYSPDRNDGYARPKFSYKITDNWLIDGGFNLFWGKDNFTFWGQFQDNTNIYAGLRYSF